MQYKKLGTTEIEVSIIALGTMTWGEQNTEQEAHAQLDYAIDQGVNFIDAAELYPVPPKPETQGLTESYIGTWLAQKSQQRDKLVIASKVAGPSAANGGTDHIREGKSRHNRANIEQALHDSLKRLKTDYIDLYQLHWPDRTTNFFGQLGYHHVEDEYTVPILETLTVLDDLVKAGKIRHIGLSNETPWGVTQFLHLAEKHNLARIVSIQNPYNLLNRSFEIGNAEIAIREKVGLLAYSPLAFGHLTGKYLNGALPEGARITKWQRFGRYKSENAVKATQLYVDLAKAHHLDPAQLALAYINQQRFVTSNIIGATNLEQLKTNIDSIHLHLSEDILSKIEKIHQQYPNPSP
ncbi:NADP(H)-dependent aldo-keto reductase [Acinetobacter puyangensis]|uniref:Protein tas n=1 Tax=Acinetobacter puyangensis TaxID=1096779 RepID=A0A240E975_9GAMM|nr:NADP(H)-dependent aldo-keto reductase [Acinetobacter puyangensis]SNX44450.1 Predicted oxidoreductase [Acinetobacter puyangensis]